jgi:hypothetical protein
MSFLLLSTVMVPGVGFTTPMTSPSRFNSQLAPVGFVWTVTLWSVPSTIDAQPELAAAKPSQQPNITNFMALIALPQASHLRLSVVITRRAAGRLALARTDVNVYHASALSRHSRIVEQSEGVVPSSRV